MIEFTFEEMQSLYNAFKAWLSERSFEYWLPEHRILSYKLTVALIDLQLQQIKPSELESYEDTYICGGPPGSYATALQLEKKRLLQLINNPQQEINNNINQRFINRGKSAMMQAQDNTGVLK
jgi:hypothetical protein